jgi:hypothetical protein
MSEEQLFTDFFEVEFSLSKKKYLFGLILDFAFVRLHR